MTREQKFRTVYEKKFRIGNSLDAACLALGEAFKDKKIERIQVARVYRPDMEMPEALEWRAEVLFQAGEGVRTVTEKKSDCLQGFGETSILAAKNVLENLQ
jgi:hypothetical protein